MAEYHITRRAHNASYSDRTAKVKTCKTLLDALVAARKASAAGSVDVTIKSDGLVARVASYGSPERVRYELPQAWADLLMAGLSDADMAARWQRPAFDYLGRGMFRAKT